MRVFITHCLGACSVLVLAISLLAQPAYAGGEGGNDDSRSTKPKNQTQSQTRSTAKTTDNSALTKQRDQLAQEVENLKKQIELAEQERKTQQWTSRQYVKDLNNAQDKVRQFKGFRDATIRDLQSRGSLDPKKKWSRETLRQKDKLVKEANELQGSIKTYEGWAREADKKLTRVQDRQSRTEATISKAKADLRRATAELKKAERALR